MKLFRFIIIVAVCLACSLTQADLLWAQSQQLRQMAQMGQNGGMGAPRGNGGGRQGGGNAGSQKKDDDEDPCVPLLDKRFCYTLDPITGLKHEQVPDTSHIGLGNRQSMESKALALVYTGNLYSPHQVESYFDRRQGHDLLFLNAYSLLRDDASQMVYYNTRIPFTAASYSKSGSSLRENDHLKINFAGNFNKQFGLGSMLDYVYARGSFLNSATKPLKWKSYLYYDADNYHAYLSYQQTKLANQENGGIAERDYILHPDRYNRALTDPNSMATQIVNTWNDNMLKQVHFQHNYDLGRWEEVFDPTDTTYTDRFVPIGTLFHSIDYESWKHIFRVEKGGAKGFFDNHYYDDNNTADSTRFNKLSTYFGIRLNEGFSRFSQFSIAGFVGYEFEQFVLQQDTLDLGFVARVHNSNHVWLGGQLSRNLSSTLTLDATAKTCVTGDKAGDVDVQGIVRSVLPFGRRNSDTGSRADSIIVEGKALFTNQHVSYLMEHYFSNHFRWSNPSGKEDGFSPEQHMRVEGKATYNRTGTSLRGGFETLTNYHYFAAPTYLPVEHSTDIEVYALELRQNLHLGEWFNWDNAILYQHSSDEDVLPLPALSIESDMSLRFRIAKTLSIQLGAAVYYHTGYYAPDYQPALQQFAVQHKAFDEEGHDTRIKCGDFPIMNAYVNCNLKRIKFFVAMHNTLGNAVTNDTFLMPYYPISPRRMELGVTLDLQN